MLYTNFDRQLLWQECLQFRFIFVIFKTAKTWKSEKYGEKYDGECDVFDEITVAEIEQIKKVAYN